MYLRAASGGGGALFGSQRLFILVPPRSVRFTQALRRFSDDDCATNFLTEGGRGSYSSLLSLACVVGGTHTLSNGNDSRRPASRSNRFPPLRQSSIWPAAVPKYPPPPSEKEDICCATVVWSSLWSRRLICQWLSHKSYDIQFSKKNMASTSSFVFCRHFSMTFNFKNMNKVIYTLRSASDERWWRRGIVVSYRNGVIPVCESRSSACGECWWNAQTGRRKRYALC